MTEKKRSLYVQLICAAAVNLINSDISKHFYSNPRLSRRAVEPLHPVFPEQHYLEVQYDGPDEAEHDGRPAVHQVGGVDVHQLDPLARQEAERRVRIG